MKVKDNEGLKTIDFLCLVLIKDEDWSLNSLEDENRYEDGLSNFFYFSQTLTLAENSCNAQH